MKKGGQAMAFDNRRLYWQFFYQTILIASKHSLGFRHE